MKFSAIFAVIALAIASVGAVVPADTNAYRLARGLAPLAPRSFGSRVDSARRSMPSGGPSHCDTGPVQCCQSTGTKSDSFVSLLLGLLDVKDVGPDVLVGVTCSPVSAVGVGANHCSAKPVCCSNNKFRGIIVVGCSPVTL